MRSADGHINIEKGKKGFQDEAGSIRHIHNWLNTNGEVMSIGKI